MAFMTFHILGRLIPSDFHILFVHIFPYLWSGYPLNFRLKTSSSIPGWTKKPAGWGTPQWSKDWVGPSDSQIDPRVFSTGFVIKRCDTPSGTQKNGVKLILHLLKMILWKKLHFCFGDFPSVWPEGIVKDLLKNGWSYPSTLFSGPLWLNIFLWGTTKVVRLIGIVEVIYGHHQHPIDECIKMIIFLVV